MLHEQQAPVYEYTIMPLFPDRLGGRWRWTLFDGDLLLAAGWRQGEHSALRALRSAAARAAREERGVRGLGPERVWLSAPFVDGMTVRLEAGGAACVLAPRAILAPAA